MQLPDSEYLNFVDLWVLQYVLSPTISRFNYFVNKLLIKFEFVISSVGRFA